MCIRCLRPGRRVLVARLRAGRRSPRGGRAAEALTKKKRQKRLPTDRPPLKTCWETTVLPRPGTIDRLELRLGPRAARVLWRGSWGPSREFCLEPCDVFPHGEDVTREDSNCFDEQLQGDGCGDEGDHDGEVADGLEHRHRFRSRAA